MIEKDHRVRLSNEKATTAQQLSAAEKLAWHLRSRAAQKITISSLRLGKVWLSGRYYYGCDQKCTVIKMVPGYPIRVKSYPVCKHIKTAG